MLVLSLDTTTPKASCAVAREGVVVNEEPIDTSRQLALQLPGALRDILDLSGVGLDEVDAFAVSTGPGSFTGLRIGIAAMQGLAFGTSKPLIGISGFAALRAVASPAFLGSRIAAWVDAWRGDVYATLFEDGRPAADPVVAKPSDLLDELVPRGFANDVLFIGDGAETYRELIVSRLGHAARIADPSTPLLAAVIAMLATIEFKNGHRPPPHAIRPIYVRRSDAELARDRIPNPESRIPSMNVVPAFRIELLEGEKDLEGVLEVERESFTSPWTREMYNWELQNRAVCHIYIVRTPECPVAGFCAFWLVFDEIHINNIALRPHYRGRGYGTALMHHVLAEARRLGARRATLEVRAGNAGARRLYERLGFYVAGTRRNYYTNPVEDALILWRDDPSC